MYFTAAVMEDYHMDCGPAAGGPAAGMDYHMDCGPAASVADLVDVQRVSAIVDNDMHHREICPLFLWTRTVTDTLRYLKFM